MCSIRGKVFTTRTHYDTHVRTLTSWKIYLFHTCVAHSTQKDVLTKHSRKHAIDHPNSFQYLTNVYQLRWSRGKRAGLWYPSSRFQKPGRSLRIFLDEKILSTPSFGGDVNPSVPCRKFMACKRTQKWRGSRHFRQNCRPFLAHSSTFRCWGSLASFQAWGTLGGGSWNVLITGPPCWGVWLAAGKGTL